MKRVVLFLCLIICTISVIVGTENLALSNLSGRSEIVNVAQTTEFDVLVFSKTLGFRHASIPAGIAAIKSLGRKYNFTVAATEDANVFTDASLAKYRVVVFLNTTGDILNAKQQSAFERFIRKGRGFVGIHAATDTEYDWGWYGRLVGTYFANHPQIQQATVNVTNRTHLSTQKLPDKWIRTDEWYNFRDNPSRRVNVLAKLDESTYSGGTMGKNHPIAWYHRYDGGRAWYTGMGHTSETYSEPLFLEHILGGIRWAAGVTAKEIKIYSAVGNEQ